MPKYEITFEQYARIIVDADSQIKAEEIAHETFDGSNADYFSDWEMVDETVELGTEA